MVLDDVSADFGTNYYSWYETILQNYNVFHSHAPMPLLILLYFNTTIIVGMQSISLVKRIAQRHEQCQTRHLSINYTRTRSTFTTQEW